MIWSLSDTSIEWPPENYKLTHKSSVNDKNYVNIIDPTTKEFSKIDVNSIDLSENIF